MTPEEDERKRLALLLRRIAKPIRDQIVDALKENEKIQPIDEGRWEEWLVDLKLDEGPHVMNRVHATLAEQDEKWSDGIRRCEDLLWYLLPWWVGNNHTDEVKCLNRVEGERATGPVQLSNSLRHFLIEAINAFWDRRRVHFRMVARDGFLDLKGVGAYYPPENGGETPVRVADLLKEVARDNLVFTQPADIEEKLGSDEGIRQVVRFLEADLAYRTGPKAAKQDYHVPYVVVHFRGYDELIRKSEARDLAQYLRLIGLSSKPPEHPTEIELAIRQVMKRSTNLRGGS